MSAKTGHKMFLYRNTGTHASPTWSVIEELSDVNMPDLSRGMAELKRRAKDWTKNLPTLIQSFSIEFKLWHGLGATQFDALRTAFFAATPYEYALFDGAIATTGSQGLIFQAFISEFPWSQNLEEVSGHDMKLAVGYMEESSAELDPAWSVTGS
jgi:hypothetical protein